MDEQNHNRQREWKAKDFERYYKNNMPPEDRNALEKAALEDPFLQDALEGYAFTHTPVDDVQMLKEKLKPGKEKATIFWYKRPAASRVLKVAAVLIFFVGITWIFLSRDNDNTSQELAVIQKDQSLTNPVDSATNRIATEAVIQDKFEADPVEKDVNTNNTANAKANNKINIQADVAGAKEASIPAVASSTASTPAVNVAADFRKADSVEVVNLGIASSVNKSVRKANLDTVGDAESAGSARLIRGRVLDTDGLPVPYARIKGDANGQILASDKEGYFSLHNGANMVNVNVNALGYETTAAMLTPENPENKIILKETQNLAIVNDRAASALNIKSAKDDLLVKKARPVSGQNVKKNIPVVSLVNAIPLQGFIKYNEHIKNMLENESQPLVKGDVTVSFHIDSAGRPGNFKIVKSLQPAADAAAIDILKRALPLKPLSNSKISSATIRFE